MEQNALLFSTRGSRILAEKIADHYGGTLGNLKIVDFSDGEFQPAFEQSVRGSRVFLTGSTFQPRDNLMELLLMCEAAKRDSTDQLMLRDTLVVLVGSAFRPSDDLMERALMCYAATRASADKSTAVLPHFRFARHDRIVAPRVPIEAK